MINYIDLTRVVDEHTPVYPGDNPLEITKTGDLDHDGFLMHEIKMGMHVGTHMDAPAHFIARGKEIAGLGVEKFFGTGVIVELGEEVPMNALERAQIALIRTGMSEMWGTDKYFKEYPELSEKLVSRLIAAKVQMICVDMPSVDYAPHTVHKKLLAEEILIVENVCNLEKLPRHQEFKICALPLNLSTEASPCRVVAEISY
ncbi:MAG: cyclase [Patescibacteria group bacterium]|nr:MAG: cyclase [Patescibacteria group bacterium]